MSSIDAVIDGMYGKMCPFCFGTIFPGEFHSCPAQGINEIAEERDTLRNLLTDKTTKCEMLDGDNNDLFKLLEELRENYLLLEEERTNLNEKLEIAVEALKLVSNHKAGAFVCEYCWDMKICANEALKKLEE